MYGQTDRTMNGWMDRQTTGTGSLKADGRKLKSSLGLVFNFKIAFVMSVIEWHAKARTNLSRETGQFLNFSYSFIGWHASAVSLPHLMFC